MKNHRSLDLPVLFEDEQALPIICINTTKWNDPAHTTWIRGKKTGVILTALHTILACLGKMVAQNLWCIVTFIQLINSCTVV